MLAGICGTVPEAKPITTIRPSQAIERSDGLEHGAAHRVVDDVGTPSAGELAHGRLHVVARRCRARGRRRGARATASLSAPRAVAMTVAPIALPTSTAVRPTPPAGAVDQQRLARVQVGAPAQGAMGRAVGDREAGGRRVVHVVGQRDDVVRAGDRLLGEAAVVDEGQDPLPGLEAGDARAHGLDLARQLEAGRERQRRLLLVPAAQHQAVGEVHARGARRGSARRRRPAPAAAGRRAPAPRGRRGARQTMARMRPFPFRPRTSGEHRGGRGAAGRAGRFRRGVLATICRPCTTDACGASSRSGPRASASR